MRLDRLDDAERANFSQNLRSQSLDPTAARRIARVRDDLLRAVRRLGAPSGPGQGSGGHDDEEALLQDLLLAYPDRVARRRGPGMALGVMVGGRGVRLDESSCVVEDEFFLAIDPREQRRGGVTEVYVRIASGIEREWLAQHFPEAIHRQRVLEFVEATGKVIGISRVLYHDLVIREDRHGAVEPTEAAGVLAEALGRRATPFVRGDDRAAAWLDRVACLREWLPSLGLPDFDDDELADVIAAACVGCRSVEDVRRVPLVPLLTTRLEYALARQVDELAPEFLTVPSGSRIKLHYEPGRPPVLAARVQELFGWTETPRIAEGHVPVLVHLLAPNYRPVQITDNLNSFWTNTYTQVRKNLRARYPKHAWPEDPWTARAEAKGRARQA